jgi:hypothetical protein
MLSVNWRSPFLASLKLEMLGLATILIVILMIAEIRQFKSKKITKFLSGLTLAISIASFTIL